MARSKARERELARRRYERRRLRQEQLRQRRRRRNTIIGAVVGTLAVIGGLIALVVTLVGGSSNKSTVAQSSTSPSDTPSSSAPAAPTTCAKISPNPPTKATPMVPPVTGTAPTKLVVKDLKPGTGAAAKSGQTLTVDYVGVSCSTGTMFDTSYGKQPFSFTLGKGEVIQGWDQGMVGMKVGGKRELIIPASLGYGATGQGGIKPNETLIFVVELRKLK